MLRTNLEPRKWTEKERDGDVCDAPIRTRNYLLCEGEEQVKEF